MRFPNARDLNDEQEQVYLYAPDDGRILVTGPPGTGKSVLAVLRGHEAARAGKRVVIAMFNRLLAAYARSDAPLENDKRLEYTTVHKFFSQLWDKLHVPPTGSHPWLHLLVVPEEHDTDPYGNTIYYTRDAVDKNEWVKCKNQAEGLGAKYAPSAWHPEAEKPGCLKVSRDIYNMKPHLFKSRRPRPPVPSPKDNDLDIDWECYLHTLIDHADSLNWQAVNFDLLIVDEAQDFPPAFFDLLGLLEEGALGNEVKPSLMILADENQRLTASNSSIDQIRNHLEIDDNRWYKLHTNFRNTRQIANVAGHFFVGMQTGIPHLPEREGSVPELRRFTKSDELYKRILTYAENNPKAEIGVICLGGDSPRSLHVENLEKLSRKFPEIRIQSYSSVDDNYHSTKGLSFSGARISVFNSKSCKGLEFDAVFIVELHALDVSEERGDHVKMEMYVMSSRARRDLFYYWRDLGQSSPPVLALMPDTSKIRIIQ